MKKNIIFLLVLISVVACGQEKSETMYLIYDESEENCGYINKNGDTLVPFGECMACFSDSLNYAIVIKSEGDHGPVFLAINSKGKEIFRVFAYDNGPDYIEDGTMRIIKDGKIGYATEAGEIIIEPTYEAANPFENGRAKVSVKATKVQDGEHWSWSETDWFFIDKKGNRIED